MTRIVPINLLKNTAEITELCEASDTPIHVTKNGYGSLVIMSEKVYNESMYLVDVYRRLAIAEKQARAGEVLDAEAALADIRGRHNV